MKYMIVLLLVQLFLYFFGNWGDIMCRRIKLVVHFCLIYARCNTYGASNHKTTIFYFFLNGDNFSIFYFIVFWISNCCKENLLLQQLWITFFFVHQKKIFMGFRKCGVKDIFSWGYSGGTQILKRGQFETPIEKWNWTNQMYGFAKVTTK